MRTRIEEKQKELICLQNELITAYQNEEIRPVKEWREKYVKIDLLKSEIKALKSSDNGEYYEKVVVNSIDDLPEEGEYFCNRSGFKTVQNMNRNLPDKSYQREIRWYLRPPGGKEENDNSLRVRQGEREVDYIKEIETRTGF